MIDLIFDFLNNLLANWIWDVAGHDLVIAGAISVVLLLLAVARFQEGGSADSKVSALWKILLAQSTKILFFLFGVAWGVLWFETGFVAAGRWVPKLMLLVFALVLVYVVWSFRTENWVWCYAVLMVALFIMFLYPTPASWVHGDLASVYVEVSPRYRETALQNVQIGSELARHHIYSTIKFSWAGAKRQNPVRYLQYIRRNALYDAAVMITDDGEKDSNWHISFDPPINGTDRITVTTHVSMEYVISGYLARLRISHGLDAPSYHDMSTFLELLFPMGKVSGWEGLPDESFKSLDVATRTIPDLSYLILKSAFQTRNWDLLNWKVPTSDLDLESWSKKRVEDSSDKETRKNVKFAKQLLLLGIAIQRRELDSAVELDKNLHDEMTAWGESLPSSLTTKYYILHVKLGLLYIDLSKDRVQIGSDDLKHLMKKGEAYQDERDLLLGQIYLDYSSLIGKGGLADNERMSEAAKRLQSACTEAVHTDSPLSGIEACYWGYDRIPPVLSTVDWMGQAQKIADRYHISLKEAFVENARSSIEAIQAEKKIELPIQLMAFVPSTERSSKEIVLRIKDEYNKDAGTCVLKLQNGIGSHDAIQEYRSDSSCKVTVGTDYHYRWSENKQHSGTITLKPRKYFLYWTPSGGTERKFSLVPLVLDLRPMPIDIHLEFQPQQRFHVVGEPITLTAYFRGSLSSAHASELMNMISTHVKFNAEIRPAAPLHGKCPLETPVPLNTDGSQVVSGRWIPRVGACDAYNVRVKGVSLGHVVYIGTMPLQSQVIKLDNIVPCTMQIADNNVVWIYGGPSAQHYDRIKRPEAGETFKVTGKDAFNERWVRIDLGDGKEGWIYNSPGHVIVHGSLSDVPILDKRPPSNPHVITVRDVILLSGPGERCEKVSKMGPGTDLKIQAQSVDGQWWKVQYKGGTGWIRKDNVGQVQGTTEEIKALWPLDVKIVKETNTYDSYGDYGSKALVGDRFSVTGKSQDGKCLQSYLGDVSGVWIDSSAVEYIAGNICAVPVVRKDCPKRSPQGPYVLAKGNDVPLHSGPGQQCGIVTTVTSGTELAVTAQSADREWWKVKYTGTSGWIAKGHASQIRGADKEIEPLSLSKVRILKNTDIYDSSGNVEHKVYAGDYFSIVGKSGDGNCLQGSLGDTAGVWIESSAVEYAKENVCAVPVVQAKCPERHTFVPPCIDNYTILFPRPGATISGNVTITGNIAVSGFQQYKVEYVKLSDDARLRVERENGVPTPTPLPDGKWHVIVKGVKAPAHAHELATWATTSVPDGVYELRLVIDYVQNGHWKYEPRCRIRVRVQNKKP